jgi:hypothetical protein
MVAKKGHQPLRSGYSESCAQTLLNYPSAHP